MAIIQYGGIRIDVQANTQGVKALRTDIAALTRLVNESSGPAGKFERDLNRIAKVSEDGAANQELLKKATDASIKRFLAASAATGNYLQALQHVAAVIPAAAGRMKQLEVQFLRQQKATDDAAQAERRLADAEANQARALQYAQGIIDQYSTKEQRRAVIVRQLTADLRAGLITQEHYNRAIEASNRLQAKTQERGGLKSFATGILGGLSPIGAVSAGAAGFFAGREALEFTQDTVRAYTDLRSSLIKLEVVLGSRQRAIDTHRQLRQIAVASSQTSDAVMHAAVTMAQFGVSSDQIIPTMRRLTEVSAGNSEKLQSLAIAYGQVAAAGRLTGQETLQFVNAGFNPLAEIARTTGKNMADLRKEMEEGKISVQMVADAFKSATEEGGRFFGMTEKLSSELSGQISRTKDEYLKLKEALGETISPGVGTLFYRLENLSKDARNMLLIFDELPRALNRGGGDREFAFRAQGRVLGTKGGFMDPLSEAEKQAAAREFKSLQAQLEQEAEAVRKAQEQEFATEFMRQGFVSKSIASVADSFANQISQLTSSLPKVSDQFTKLNQKAEQAAEMMTRFRSRMSQTVSEEEKYAQLISEFADYVRSGLISFADASKRIAMEMPKKDAAISADLPKAVSMGTREAYELINRTQSTMQSKQLEEQRRQRMAQEAANKLLEQLNKKQGMGILN
jgi:tape measure domain-containing protein